MSGPLYFKLNIVVHFKEQLFGMSNASLQDRLIP